MLLKNVRFAVTPHGTLQDVNIVIAGNEIESITKDIPKNSKHSEVVDCSGFLAMPGLVNAHTHVAMTFLRGYGDDVNLQDWLARVWPAEAKLTREDVYAFALMGCLEMVRSGCTSFNDMYFHSDSIAKACIEAGLRGFLAGPVLSVPGMEKIASVEVGEAFVREWHGRELITPFFGPHSIYGCDEETLRRTTELAQRYQTRVHIHLSETRKEVYDCWRERGVRPVEYLARIGFLGERVIAAHCGWLTKNEIKILGERRVNVVHCPASNMKLATGGELPLPELLQSGANVALGTDGAASNNNLSLLEEMKFAALLHKHARWDPTAADARTVFDMATKGGARGLGLNAGTLEEGRLADVVLIDLDNVYMQPVSRDRLLAHLVYSADSSCVDTVICNGKILMRNKIVEGVDEEKVREEFDKHFREIMERAKG